MYKYFISYTYETLKSGSKKTCFGNTIYIHDIDINKTNAENADKFIEDATKVIDKNLNDTSISCWDIVILNIVKI